MKFVASAKLVDRAVHRFEGGVACLSDALDGIDVWATLANDVERAARNRR